MISSNVNIGAVVLAAGLSRRMGRPKLTLPWGTSTVIGSVIQAVLTGGVDRVIVVTGGYRQEVEDSLQDFPVEIVINPAHEEGEMLSSVQKGLTTLDQSTQAALIVLGDQPQIRAETVKALLSTFHEKKAPIIVPSYHMRRGHPWIVIQELWNNILDLHPPQTLRDFLQDQTSKIHYLTVDNSSVLLDLDTPEQYEQYHKP